MTLSVHFITIKTNSSRHSIISFRGYERKSRADTEGGLQADTVNLSLFYTYYASTPNVLLLFSPRLKLKPSILKYYTLNRLLKMEEMKKIIRRVYITL